MSNTNKSRTTLRLNLWLLTAFVTFSIGVMMFVLLKGRHSEVRQPSNQAFRLIIPSATWEPFFFRDINSVTRLTAQPRLRDLSLEKDEYEARVWWGFGLAPLEGISLKYSAGQWSAIHVRADTYYDPRRATREELKPPRSGWNATWQRLVDSGMLSLVDATEVNCGDGGLDGISFVVETNIDRTYRTYMYPNPMSEKCRQAKQVMKIFDILAEEFEWTHPAPAPPPNKRLVSGQDDLSYRCPRGDSVLPASCLEQMEIKDDMRVLSAKERHQLAYLFSKSYVISKVEYGQDYCVESSAPIFLLAARNFPEWEKLRFGEGGLWLGPTFEFFRAHPEYRADVERALLSVPAAKRRQFLP